MIARLLLFLMTAAGLVGQTPNLPDLKTVLDLSDAQIQSLGQLEQQKAQALQPIALRMEQDRKSLEALVSNPAADAATAGRLILEIAALGRQAQNVGTGFQQQASNLLQPAQKTKLQALSQALQLQLAAQQAAALGLIAAPANSTSEPDPAK